MAAFELAKRTGLARWRPHRVERYLLLVVPTIAYLLAFFVYPLAGILWKSFTTDASSALSVGSYEQVVLSPVYLQVILTTFLIALLTTAVTLVLAYPLAYFLSQSRPRMAN
ncbi:MAG: hypothetical protein KGJ86_15130, partial [Chloroflexota bacterium]|nr:hypothetical protein [Chloroflexota bacterium]